MESNNRNDMPAFMDTDLDPYTLVHDIVSNWWVIILGAIAGALLTYVVVSSRYPCEGAGRDEYAGLKCDGRYAEGFHRYYPYGHG